GRRRRRGRTGQLPRRALRRTRRGRSRDARSEGEDLVKVHALVEDLETARRAIVAGATVVQLRVKGPTEQVVAAGRAFRALGTTFVVNDDVDAALELGADGVHLGQSDQGAARARARGLLLGRSATTYAEALGAAADADYLGVGPIWPIPSKADAAP